MVKSLLIIIIQINCEAFLFSITLLDVPSHMYACTLDTVIAGLFPRTKSLLEHPLPGVSDGFMSDFTSTCVTQHFLTQVLSNVIQKLCIIIEQLLHQHAWDVLFTTLNFFLYVHFRTKEGKWWNLLAKCFFCDRVRSVANSSVSSVTLFTIFGRLALSTEASFWRSSPPCNGDWRQHSR